MSQKSSLPQAAKAVSHVLMSDTRSQSAGSCAADASLGCALPHPHTRTEIPKSCPIRACPPLALQARTESYSLNTVSNRKIQQPARTRFARYMVLRATILSMTSRISSFVTLSAFVRPINGRTCLRSMPSSISKPYAHIPPPSERARSVPHPCFTKRRIRLYVSRPS
jgi:hypothetical protein